MENIKLCKNVYCSAYIDNTCQRAVLSKEAIEKRIPFQSYINYQNYEKPCDYFIKNK